MPGGAGLRTRHGSATGRTGRAGFTLVEVLVAFLILATLTVTIQRGGVQWRSGWVAVETRARAEHVARSLLAEPIGLEQARAGGWTGTVDHFRYTVRLTFFSLPVAAGAESAAAESGRRRLAWIPMRLNLRIESGTRVILSLETIRLCPFETTDASQVPPGRRLPP